MTIHGPTRGELEHLQAAAERGDADRLYAVYAAVNARLGVPASTDPEWAMRLIADGCRMALTESPGQACAA